MSHQHPHANQEIAWFLGPTSVTIRFSEELSLGWNQNMPAVTNESDLVGAYQVGIYLRHHFFSCKLNSNFQSPGAQVLPKMMGAAPDMGIENDYS